MCAEQITAPLLLPVTEMPSKNICSCNEAMFHASSTTL